MGLVLIEVCFYNFPTFFIWYFDPVQLLERDTKKTYHYFELTDDFLFFSQTIFN